MRFYIYFQVKFKKSEFKGYFPEKWTEEAIELSEYRQVWDVTNSPDKMTAVLKVSNNQIFNIVLYQTRHFVAQYHCTCSAFKPDTGCVHILALLYRTQSRKESLSRTNTSPRYSFEQLLQMISADELEEFVRFIVPVNAQLQRQFRQFFEYKFLSGEKLLDSYVSRYTRDIISSDGSKNKKAINDLEYTFNTHLFRAEKLLRESEYIESFQIVSVLLISALDIEDKLSFTILKNDFYFKIHQLLAEYQNFRLAPEFYLNLNKLYFQELNHPMYQYFRKNNAIECLKGNQEYNLESLLISKINDIHIERKGPWLYYGILLSLDSSADALQNVLDSYCSKVENLIPVLDFAIEKGQLTSDLVSELDRYILINFKHDLTTELIDAVSRYYIHSGQLAHYIVLFNQVKKSGKWSENALLQKINFNSVLKHPHWVKSILDDFTVADKVNYEELYLRIMAASGLYEDLWEHIKEFANVPALSKYYSLLIKFSISMDDEILTGMIRDYLDVYMGDLAGEVIENLLKEMLFAGRPEQIKLVRKIIDEHYSDRKALVKRIQSY